MMKFKTPRIHIPRPRKHVIIIAIVALFVIAVAVYGFLSYVTWRDLDQESKQVSSSLKTAIEEALGAKKDTMSPVAEMKTLISDFNKKYSDTPCTVSSFMNWQTIIPQVKTITTECDERFTNALAVIDSLKLMTAFIETEKKASDLLISSIEATKVPTDYTAAGVIWKATSASTYLSNTGSFQPVADKIKQISTAIGTAYDSLALASTNEDKVALDEAIAALNAAYTSIGDIAALTSSERQIRVTNVTEAYDRL